MIFYVVVSAIRSRGQALSWGRVSLWLWRRVHCVGICGEGDLVGALLEEGPERCRRLAGGLVGFAGAFFFFLERLGALPVWLAGGQVDRAT